MKLLHQGAYVLVWIGALNWGGVGLLGTDYVSMLLGSWPGLLRLVYILVGLSGVYLIATHKSYCKICGDKK